MKLTDLNPHWVTVPQAAPGYHGDDSSYVKLYIGITFRCPHCHAGERGEVFYIGIFFANPVDPDNWLPRITPLGKLAEHVWNRTGDTFETLSLTPSVDASKYGHWHGFITNGEVR